MDVEKTMQFILDQQAHFSSDIARINLIQERTNEILARLADRQTTTEESFAEFQQKTEQIILGVGQTLLDVANSQERTNEILANLAERQTKTENATESLADRQGRTNEILESLAKRQTTTEESFAEFQQKTEQIIVEVGRSLLDVANSQERTNEILATEEAMRRLAERQATTEENLNVLLLTVERHIANHN